MNRSASSGMTPRQLCVAAPVPWSRASAGPLPSVWTCQVRPPAATNRLASRCGQWRPSTSQRGALMPR
ncbi:hypothetical protein [Novosphingobium sp. Gsoil 351]|uniref:hypothetical protein n=1 Tax=Novosphingobium sp. Gsoil 351 TaxID=2675225 RepID=UPI00351BA531